VKEIDTFDTNIVGSRRILIQGDLELVEYFHLEVGLGRRKNRGRCKWVSVDWTHNKML
jgi:hypothetical protein